MIRTVGLAVALLIGAPGLSAVALAEGKIVISNWDGYMPKDLPEKFKAATGIEVEVAVHATNEEIMGKVVASGGKGYDVVFVSSPFAEALNKLGMAEPIDHAKIPNLANLYPGSGGSCQHDPGNTFSVPYTWGTTGLCYRSDLVKTAPTSWNDLLKPADDAQGQDHHAGDRPLAAGGGLAGAGHVGQRDRPGQARAGQGRC